MCTSEPWKGFLAPLRRPADRYIRRWISTSSTGEFLWITEPQNRPVDIHSEYLSGGLSTEHYPEPYFTRERDCCSLSGRCCPLCTVSSKDCRNAQLPVRKRSLIYKSTDDPTSEACENIVRRIDRRTSLMYSGWSDESMATS